VKNMSKWKKVLKGHCGTEKMEKEESEKILVGNQKKLDKNKNNKIDAEDFKILRKKHPALKRAGVSGFSKPKRTPKHPKKSHVVVVRDGKKVKTIRFGEQGASVAGKPKKGESKRMKAKRKSFKSRHSKNIKRGKTSAAYWANKVKW